MFLTLIEDKASQQNIYIHIKKKNKTKSNIWLCFPIFVICSCTHLLKVVTDGRLLFIVITLSWYVKLKEMFRAWWRCITDWDFAQQQWKKKEYYGNQWTVCEFKIFARLVQQEIFFWCAYLSKFIRNEMQTTVSLSVTAVGYIRSPIQLQIF